MTIQGYDLEARQNWHRYLYTRDRGHLEYMAQAQKNEGMYLGGGEQWSKTDRAVLDDQGRPAYEFNEIMPSINSALGHQIQNRMDIAFKPRGGQADLLKATALSKVAMQVADQNKLHWLETQVYGDGLIEQRGYFDIRMSFDKNIKGEIIVTHEDPRDIIPDPDAKSYDPDQWADVTKTRWLTLDEIQQHYGMEARRKAELSGDDGPSWGEAEFETERNSFGTTGMVGAQDAYLGEGALKRYRIIDRQYWVTERTRCLVFPDSGDVKSTHTMSIEQVTASKMLGAMEATRMMRRIKWVVSTYCATLHSEWSPYEHFTIVPYFAYFRRGKTRGMVDNGVGPQEALNKAVSQFIHIVNSAANSGWIVEENSLSNMDTEELEDVGAQTGLVVEYRKGSKAPEKIVPNSVPSGVDRLIDRATQALKDVTVPDAMRGLQGNAVSGVAKQADQFASQQVMAVPLDNLAYTRHMLAGRMCKLMQRYYDSYRVFRITEKDPMTGKDFEKVLEINTPTEDGGYFNDGTVGTYDAIITEQPMAISFENSQFVQSLEMRKNGVQIPDATVVRYSSLADKHEILEQMQATNPGEDAVVELTKAKALLTRAQAVAVDVETIYSAVQTAGAISMNPAISPLADSVLGSGGFEDKNAAPLVPTPDPGTPAMLPAPNTNPLTPANPQSAATGAHAGIETGVIESPVAA